MALLNVALADAAIASWKAKYLFDIWRPIDAIRSAASEANSSTDDRANWLPLLKTPPFPSYTSGHSTFSGAAAAVLTALFGDHYVFSSTSDGHTGLTQLTFDTVVERSFTDFWSAAEEAGMSRIYGGIHFQFDNLAGLEVGRKIGEYVARNLLLARE